MLRSALLSLVAFTFASAQWLGYPTAGVRRTADGKPNLTAPTPRAANGKPDLSGLWMPEGDPSLGDPSDPRPRYFLDIFGRLTPKTIPAELQPSAAQVYARTGTVLESSTRRQTASRGESPGLTRRRPLTRSFKCLDCWLSSTRRIQPSARSSLTGGRIPWIRSRRGLATRLASGKQIP